MSAITVPVFDYSAIADPLIADTLRNRAGEINALRTGIEANFMQIGQHLLAAKDQLPHGQFQAYVEQACNFSIRTANRLMAVASEFGQIGHGGRFGVSILEQLAAAPDPKAALAEAESLADDGVPVTRDLAKAIRHDVEATAATGESSPEDKDDDEDPASGIDEYDKASALRAMLGEDEPEESDTADEEPRHLDKVRDAFGQGSEIKSTAMVGRLTGLSEADLEAALTQLVSLGELKQIGTVTYQRLRALPQNADSRPTENEQAIGVLGSKLYNWLKEHAEPANVLEMNMAVDPKTRLVDVRDAIEHMIGMGWIEEVPNEHGSHRFRAITLEDHRQRNPDPWKPSEDGFPKADAHAAVETFARLDPAPEATLTSPTMPALTSAQDGDQPGETQDNQPGEAASADEPPAAPMTAEKLISTLTEYAQGKLLEQLHALRSTTESGLKEAWKGQEVDKVHMPYQPLLASEVKKWSSGSPWRVGYVLTDLGRQVLDLLTTRYPDAITAGDATPLAALQHLEALLDAVKRAENAARDLTKFSAQDAWRDVDASTLKTARTTLRRAQGMIDAAARHLVNLDGPLSRALMHAQHATTDGDEVRV